ncbi:unnamed protein product [Didymodactylos carnosus]|nr:unnamed protein product [Didymodactylos carnosus]
MKTWFAKYLNIAHIDSTFKVNIENYQLYVCLAQNANLKGVPVAYSLMTSGNKDNLEFFCLAMSKNNDLTQTQVAIVDKALTNVDILQQYFDKARVLLCVFHVLKYLKNRINMPIRQSNEYYEKCSKLYNIDGKTCFSSVQNSYL